MVSNPTMLGFSGHRHLADPTTVSRSLALVLDHLLARYGPLEAVASAASGADTLFLEEIARRGLPYRLVLPFPRERFAQDFCPADWQRVLPLIQSAARVEELPGLVPASQAYLQATRLVATRADVMLVVWDGRPAAGTGGTGDAVAATRAQGKPLIIIDPVHGQTASAG